MKIHTIFTVLFFLLISACQRGGSAPAIPVTASTVPAPTVGATPTINIVTLVVPTRTLTLTHAEPEIMLTMSPFPSPTTSHIGDRPLLIPRLVHTSYSPERTNLQIGFDIDPALRRGNETAGEIYDITLTDQTGREIPGESTSRLQAELAEAEFAPLPQGVTELTLSAELALHGVPADGMLVIDLSGHQAGDSWPIQAMVHFGNLAVRLHTARLSIYESGPLQKSKQQLQIELLGDNAQLNGAQLLCLWLVPQPAPIEGSVGCGQEKVGISASVDLGPMVEAGAPLPMPAGSVTFEVMADFLLPGYWEATWPVKP